MNNHNNRERIESYSVEEIQRISKEELDKCDENPQYKLDLKNETQLDEKVLKAIFSGIREDWKDINQLDRFIVMSTLSGDLHNQICQYLNDINKESIWDKIKKYVQKKPKKVVITAVLGLGMLGVVGIGIKNLSSDYFLKPKVSRQLITMGSVTNEEGLKKLEGFLEEELRPKNFLDYIRRKKIDVEVEIVENESYPQAIAKVKNKEWDIVFGYSPVISLIAEDQKYTYVANQFPDSETYQSVIFTNLDSPINNINDITKDHTIALGESLSASTFILPVYDLYGKTLNVEITDDNICDLVKTKQVDLGVRATNPNRPCDNVKELGSSRDIPSAAVFVSPEVDEKDRETLKKVMLNAPQEIRDTKNGANYGEASSPDYTEFRKIVEEVRSISACVDFSVNPVNMGSCESKKQKKLIFKDEIQEIEEENGKVILIVNRNNQKCKIAIKENILKEVSSYIKVNEFKGKILDGYVSIPENSSCQDVSYLEVYQPIQIQIYNKQ